MENLSTNFKLDFIIKKKSHKFSFVIPKKYTLFPQIVSAEKKVFLLGKKLKFGATIGISYNFQIQKRIASDENIRGNTVYKTSYFPNEIIKNRSL